MKVFTFLLLILNLLFFSCKQGIEKEKITIIENIVLGNATNSYNKQLDSLQIPHKGFLTDQLLFSGDLGNRKNYYRSYYSNVFDFIEYKSNKKTIEHLGLIIPMSFEGTKNNFGLLVLLCHSDFPWYANQGQLEKIESQKYISQFINEGEINKIYEMYKSKYGVPKSVDTSNQNSFWQLYGTTSETTLMRWKDDETRGITTKWETEYYNIIFFSGIETNSKYSFDDGYSDFINTILIKKGHIKELPKYDLPCRSFAYIYYQLNSKAIELLKINTKKI